MTDTPTGNPLVENAKSFVAGGFGGVCAVMTGHPFDLTKVLLQTNQYKTLTEAVKGTVKAHGPLGLYKGVTSPLLGVTPMFAVSFWGYDLGKRIVTSLVPKGQELGIAEISAAGFLSAIPTTAIAAPFERVKVVMQVTKENVSFMDTVRKLYKEGGVKSIYKGTAATLGRDGPGSAVYFATYEVLKNYLSKKPDDSKGPLEDEEAGTLSLSAIMIAGGFAGVAMWTTIFPMDTIKSVQQSSPVKLSISQVSKQIYQAKGIAGFFPGIGPALLRSFPANAATFLGVELARNAMDSVF